LEALADAGTVMISGTAYDQVEKKLPIGFEYRGDQRVKNIDKPVRVYRVLTDAAAAGRTIHAIRRPRRYWRKIGVSAAVVLLFLGGVVGAYVRPWEAAPRRAPASGDKPSIAVLPFANMSGDPKQDYFTDGMTDDVITALSQVTGLFVIARNSSFTYKGTSVDVQKIAKDLEVRYVLEGSVQRAGDRVRITAWLVDPQPGATVGPTSSTAVSDVFALQDKVKRSVADALAVQLAGAGAQSPATRKPTYRGL
jgi:TolB-like protein